MEKQQNIQKYVICAINLIITYISLIGKDIAQLHAFSNISWMLGCLADNLKSFQYYVFVSEFLLVCKTFEKYKFECESKTIIGNIDKVDFVNASFGYYSEDLTNKPDYIQKISNLTYSFKRGLFYYLEAPNGIGKSTMLKMFTSNLNSGDIYFGSINRKHLSFEDISSRIFHIVQASEYTPKFTTEEIKAYKGLDPWLEKQLGLTDLLSKDTVEMSGGQKKRIFIYIVLTSNAPILLLDEILSELSTEETPDVPEGGGWLSRVINTMINWNNRQNKIIILVGHGLLELIPQQKHVIKLRLENTKTKSMLTIR
jgi:ABC-type cobalamin/Fe3+-siderophores transport system ATPase subunit